jgi:hypothetical protein
MSLEPIEPPETELTEEEIIEDAASRLAEALRAKPELMCPDELSTRSPLPVGRVDLRAVVSGYSDSGFAIAGHVT